MPEHDEDDAPELAEEDEFWAEVEEIEARRAMPKTKRWKVENKVVEPDTK